MHNDLNSISMKNEILTNGFYFKQIDEKKTGNYTTNEKGELIHHKYKSPTTWQRTKYFLKYGYHMDTDTIQTSFFYFRPADKIVYHNTMMGDAISLARDIRSFKFSISKYEYKEMGDGIKVELEKVILNLKLSEDGKILNVYGEFKNSTNRNTTDVYTFLDWSNI